METAKVGGKPKPVVQLPSSTDQETLLWITYLTNEFGCPSEKYEDLFMGQLTLINNIKEKFLTLGKLKLTDLERLYIELIKEGDRNLIDVQYNGGRDFYERLIERKPDTEDEIRAFIKNYRNKYQGEEAMARYELDLHITPELVRTDADGREYIEVHMEGRKYKADGRLYGDGTALIMVGSEITQVADRLLDFDKSPILSVRDSHGVPYDKTILTRDLELNTPSQFGCLVRGNSSNGWLEILNSNGDPIDIYRKQSRMKPKQGKNNLEGKKPKSGRAIKISEAQSKKGELYNRLKEANLAVDHQEHVKEVYEADKGSGGLIIGLGGAEEMVVEQIEKPEPTPDELVSLNKEIMSRIFTSRGFKDCIKEDKIITVYSPKEDMMANIYTETNKAIITKCNSRPELLGVRLDTIEHLTIGYLVKKLGLQNVGEIYLEEEKLYNDIYESWEVYDTSIKLNDIYK